MSLSIVFLMTGCAVLVLCEDASDHRKFFKTQPTHKPTDNNNNRRNQLANVQLVSCRNDLHLDKADEVHIIWRELMPYAVKSGPSANTSSPPTGLIPQTLGTILATCCKDFSELAQWSLYSQRSVNDTDMETDIVYGAAMAAMPVQAPAQLSLQGRFVPVVQSPGAAFIVGKTYVPASVIKSLSYSQYLLLFVLAVAGVAGVLIWMFEHRSNSLQFPKAFHQGFFNGLWWSVITMTTVGYGDKTPRTFFGRLFALLWVIAGVFLITTFTATVTSSLTTASLNSDIHVQGSKVAVVKGAPEYRLAVLSGANVSVQTDTLMDALLAVQSQDVDGALIDQLSLGEAITEGYGPLSDASTGLQIAQVIVHNVDFGIFFTPTNRTTDRLEECANLVVRNMEENIYLSVQQLSSVVEERRLHTETILLQFLRSFFAESWVQLIGIAYGVLAALLILGTLYHFYPLYSTLLCKRTPKWSPSNRTLLLNDDQAALGNDQIDDQSTAGNQSPHSRLESTTELTSPLQNLLLTHWQELEALEDKRSKWLVSWEKERQAVLKRHRKEQGLDQR